MKWRTFLQELATTRVGCLRLGVAVQQSEDRWQAIAVETTGTDVETVFADHAHEVIGVYDTLESAKAACESFARAWRRRRRQSVENPCDCAAISKPDAPPTSG